MKKALFVGLTKYPKNELKWCDNDAIAMRTLIERNGDGSKNFDCVQILDECDKGELSSAIRKLFSGNADVALLYFSGHGTDVDGGYLVTTDYNFDTSDYGVRMNDVMTWANESSCRNKVIILDCCFSGSMGEALLVNNKSVLGDGVTIIAASQADETSVENNDIQHGLFTDLLLQGLSGGAADINGRITPAGLYSYVDQALGAWEQRPVFKSNISEFLPIRIIQAKVPRKILQDLPKLFESATDEYPLDPSYEFTNDPNVKHEICEPYANENHVKIFKELQIFESVGLVEPVGEEHMYFAAMHNKSCRLTALGTRYWKLAKDERF